MEGYTEVLVRPSLNSQRKLISEEVGQLLLLIERDEPSQAAWTVGLACGFLLKVTRKPLLSLGQVAFSTKMLTLNSPLEQFLTKFFKSYL